MITLFNYYDEVFDKDYRDNTFFIYTKIVVFSVTQNKVWH